MHIRLESLEMYLTRTSKAGMTAHLLECSRDPLTNRVTFSIQPKDTHPETFGEYVVYGNQVECLGWQTTDITEPINDLNQSEEKSTDGIKKTRTDDQPCNRG